MKLNRIEFKHVAYLAFPLILSNLVNAAASLISMYFLSMISTEALAAGAIITSTYGFIIMMVMSILYAVGIKVGRLHHSDKPNEVGRVVFSSMVIVAVLGMPLMILMQHMNSIFTSLGQPAVIARLAGDYFKGISFGLIPSLMTAVYMQLFMGAGSSKVIPYLTIFGVVINSLLTYLLIFGFQSVPAMGVLGAGIASSLTAVILLGTVVAYLGFSKKFVHYRLFALASCHFNHMSEILRIGVPISVQYTAELFAFSALTYFMGMVGVEALSAQQVSLQCSMVSIMIVMAISQAGSILVSQAVGRRESDRIVMITQATHWLGIGAMLIIAAIYWFFPLRLISLYMDVSNPALAHIVDLTKAILAVAAFTQLFDGGRNITAGLLRGLGDSTTSMWTGIVSCWLIGLPAALLFGFVFHEGAVGIRLGMLLGITFGCVNVMYRLYRHLARLRSTDVGQAHPARL